MNSIWIKSHSVKSLAGWSENRVPRALFLPLRLIEDSSTLRVPSHHKEYWRRVTRRVYCNVFIFFFSLFSTPFCAPRLRCFHQPLWLLLRCFFRIKFQTSSVSRHIDKGSFTDLVGSFTFNLYRERYFPPIDGAFTKLVTLCQSYYMINDKRTKKNQLQEVLKNQLTLELNHTFAFPLRQGWTRIRANPRLGFPSQTTRPWEKFDPSKLTHIPTLIWMIQMF